MSLEIDIDIFDSTSLSAGVKALNKYADDIIVKTDRLLNVLAEQGYSTVLKKIDDMDIIFTGELRSSVGIEIAEGTAIIFVACDHAAFVEFGTGPVGGKSGYSGTLPSGYAHEGGTHYTEYKGMTGWWYFNEDLGVSVFTSGMTSRPFMYESAKELHNQLVSIAKEVFA